ncbi:MAG: 2-oxo acid dehydrogenase subunit E2 [Chloroflexi bacterium]|nr:2-oxo acid dehydrogenase subunit E2 [Chloroflexota bacterium]
MAEIVTMPKLGFDMAEGTLVRWVINEGEQVEKGMVLAEIETDKATVEVESNASGVMLQHLVKPGDIAPVNAPIAVIGAAGEPVDLSLISAVAPSIEQGKKASEKISPEEEKAQKVVMESAKTEEPLEELGRLPQGVRATPLARRIAEERGIDLKLVKGSGPQGRILKIDVEAYQPEEREAEERVSKTQPIRVREKQADQTIPLSRLRAAIGRRMQESFRQSPHFFVTHDYDAAPLMGLRQQYNSLVAENEKVSVNDFIIKAVALTLRQFPNLNASLDEEKQLVIQHGAVNIGVAVAVENGLLTVVCRDADLKPLAQIAAEVKGMVERTRQGKVKPEDIEGSTFSVSNLGMFEVDQFTAIINPPEAAILAVGSVREMPVVENGQVKTGLRMKATLSVDHRVSDGAEGARFMQALAQFLEKPLSMFL